MTIHFVGFRDTGTFYRAIMLFGRPDFIHNRYDHRCLADIAPEDIVIFASGDEHQSIARYSYDDSAFF